MMKIKVWLAAMVAVLCVSCGKITNPVDIFVYNGEKLPLEMQKERIFYGRMLQPTIVNDKMLVVVPESCEIPQIYIEYVNDYTAMINGYISRLQQDKKADLALIINNNNVEDIVLFDYMKRQNDTIAMTLSREEAAEIGMSLDNYDKQIEVLTLFNADTTFHAETMERTAIYTSIFLNHNVLKIIEENIFNNIENDFKTLNEKYKNSL